MQFSGKRLPAYLYLLAAALGLQVSGAFELTLGPWIFRHPHPTDAARGLAYDGKKFVLVDGYGHIFTSISALNWAAQPLDQLVPLSDVATDGTNFIAVGEKGLILYSANGTNWNAVSSPTARDLSRVVFTGDRFLIAGAAGTILSSTTALDFVVEVSNTVSNLTDLALGPGNVVASGQQTVVVSTVPGQWRPALVTTTNLFSTVTYYRGAFHNGWYSTGDPLVWSNRIGATGFTNVFSMGAASNAFGSILFRTISGGKIQRSADGSNWVSVPAMGSARSRIAVIENDPYVLGAHLYRLEPIAYARLMSLELGAAGDPLWFRAIAGSANGFVAHDAARRPYFSRDGEAWHAQTEQDPQVDTNDFSFSTLPIARVRQLNFNSVDLEISDNGQQWTLLNKPANSARHVAALRGTVVASDGFKLWASTNRMAWTLIATNLGVFIESGGSSETGDFYWPWITSLHAGHGLLIASTIYGELLYSTNGFNWRTNRTMFPAVDEFAFTPTGVLITSGSVIAESRFDGRPATVRAPSFTISANQIYFEGPLRYHQIQKTADFLEWSEFLTTTTNVSWEITEEPREFYRVISP